MFPDAVARLPSGCFAVFDPPHECLIAEVTRQKGCFCPIGFWSHAIFLGFLRGERSGLVALRLLNLARHAFQINSGARDWSTPCGRPKNKVTHEPGRYCVDALLDGAGVVDAADARVLLWRACSVQ